MGNFESPLKNANVTPVNKKDDPTHKTYFRPVRALPLLLTLFERIIYNQLGKYMDTFINKLLHGFRIAHSAQHALFKLPQQWQKELDNSRLVGTILMDLSKSLDYLSHDVIIAKSEDYGLRKSSLSLLLEYLNSRNQRVEIGL